MNPSDGPPGDLGDAGRGLWATVTAVFVFDDPREVLALHQAARLEDDIVRLRAELEEAPLVALGSMKQPVESPLLGSVRNAMALQAKLLGSIGVETSETSGSVAGRRLARQRWGA